MAIRGIVVQQSTRVSHYSRRTAELESTIVAARLGAVEVDCTPLLEAQIGAGLQMMEGSEVDLQMMAGSVAEEASNPLCWYVARLADH